MARRKIPQEIPQDHIGRKVRVWKNLHTGRWTIGTTSNRVLAQVESVTLHRATPKVSAATHGHIVNDNVRAVYARVEGVLVGHGDTDYAPGNEKAPAPSPKLEPVRCNPFRCRDFTRPDGSVWTGSLVAVFPGGSACFYASKQ